MGFADASVCPSCRGKIEQATRCPHCGLDLTTHEVQQAWQALVVADQWVDRARSLQSSGVSSSSDAPLPEHPPTAAPAPRRRSISAGSVLLGLGATFILVAGSIFISVSWGSLGVLGRALVLLAVTALIGLLGRFVTRRGLRASSEAVWSVFFGLVTLDWFAARDQGLGGLDSWPFGVSATAWAVLVIVGVLLVVAVGRRHLGKHLLAPSIVAGAASWFAAGSLAAELSDRTGDNAFWPAVLATAVVGVAGLVLRRGAVRVGAWICLAGVAFFGLFSIGFAVVEAFDHPSVHDLVVDVHGLPLLLIVAAAIGAGLLVERIRWGASSIAVAGVATLVGLPIEHAWPERGGYVAVAVLAALGAWAFARENDWFRGARLTVSVGVAGLALAASPWVARLLDTMAEGASASRTRNLAARLHPDDSLDVGRWWVVLVVTAGIAAALVAARRWPEADRVREHLTAAAWSVGVLGGVAATTSVDVPAASIGGSLVAGGAILAVVLAGKPDGWRWVGPAAVALAPLSTISSWPASVIVWPAAGLVLGAVVVRTRNIRLRCASAFVAAGWILGTVGPALELIDGDDRWTALALVVAGLVGLGIGLFMVHDDWTHLSVEIASAWVGGVGAAVGSTATTVAFAALTWTVAGAGLVVLGLTSPRRPRYRWVGSGLLGVAYVLRLAASDVDVVEAYTLPFAVFLLCVGLWAMRKEGPSSLRALLPGVTLALVPSLPQALDEPTSLRALLLGIGAAIALGVGVWRRWQVPFVAGAIVLALLVLVNVGPLTLGLPRWVLIASVGAVLLAAGITWEDRVRDGRAVIRYVGSMR